MGEGELEVSPKVVPSPKSHEYETGFTLLLEKFAMKDLQPVVIESMLDISFC